MDLSPAQKARLLGLVLLAAIIVVLAAYLIITWLEGDPTNHRGEREASPSTAGPRASTRN